MAERPLGVAILAILQMLGGLLMILAGSAIIALFPNIFTLIIGGAILILGLIGFIVGWGLWGLKSWAWMWAMIVNILSIILNIIQQNWFGLVIPVIIVLYLNQPNIKSRFR